MSDATKAQPDGTAQPAEQAKAGRCNAAETFGTAYESETAFCTRWKGHAGPHRGPVLGSFYGGARHEWPATERAE